MLKERAREISLVVAGLDLLLLIVSFLSAYYLRAHFLPWRSEAFDYLPVGPYFWLLLVSLPLFHFLFRTFRLYDSMRTQSFPGLIFTVAKAFLIAASILGSLIFLLQDKTYSRFIFLVFIGTFFILIVLEKVCMKVLLNQIRRRGYNFKNILVVGVGPGAGKLAGLLEKHPHLGMRVIGHLALNGERRAPSLRAKILGSVDDLPAILDGSVVDGVFFAVPPAELLRLEPAIWKCEEVGVQVHLRADFISPLFSITSAGEIEGIPILTLSSTPQSASLIVAKRAIDITVSLLAFLAFSPLMVLVAIAIKFTSRGPIFYRQVRCGLNGRSFTMLKFRSMRENAENELSGLESRNEMDGPVFKMKNDPRVYPIGGYLRTFSLDELPQLWNVLKGDMSLVGPRPPVPGEVKKYERWQRRRLSVKPGLTCLWQINGRNQIDFETWMKMDLEYINRLSLSLDFWILLRTIPVVLFPRGAH